MDGSIRDLADLKGTYRIIDKTEPAINLIIKKLQDIGVKKANFYLDKPISNAGRLQTLIAEVAEEYGFNINIEIIDHVDSFLYNKENVITGDSVILDNCISYVNLYKMIIDDLKDVWKIKLL